MIYFYQYAIAEVRAIMTSTVIIEVKRNKE